MQNNALLRDAFNSAILNNDLVKINNLTLDNNTIPFFIQNNKDFVNFAYENRQLGAVETLIANGAAFDIKSLFLINEFSCNQISHIDKIKPYISNIQYETSNNLIKSYACNNQLDTMIVKTNYTCIDNVLYLSDRTVSNVYHSDIIKYYTSLNSSLSPLALEALNGLIGTSYNTTHPFIIMPVGTRTYFDAANIDKTQGTSLIYVPINNIDNLEHSFAIHEFAHSLFHGLPGFKGRAYFDKISRNSYEKAAKETLLNLFTFFDKTVPNKQDVIDNNNYQVDSVIAALANHTDINFFTHLSNPDNDIRTEILMNKYVDNSTMPALSRKILLGNSLKSYMQKSNISQDEGYVLARLGEFLKRPSHELAKELIVRMLELEVYGINSKTLKIFDPLREYWEKYVSPKIQEVIKVLPVPFCDAVQSQEITLPPGVTADSHLIKISGNTTDHLEL